MKSNNNELTLLSNEDIWGANDGQLDAIKFYGSKAATTDLAILTGAFYNPNYFSSAPDDNTLKGRTGRYYTSTSNGREDVCAASEKGSMIGQDRYNRYDSIRPVLISPDDYYEITTNRTSGYNGTEEVEYGEYPQYAPSLDMQKRLENDYQAGLLKKTGRHYTFDKTSYINHDRSFQPIKYAEYEYNGKKYIRVKAKPSLPDSEMVKLSNGEVYRNGSFVWVEVSPVVWLIDDKAKKLISKKNLLAGIRFHTSKRPYDNDLSTSEVKEYLDNYMFHELTRSGVITHDQDVEVEEEPEEQEVEEEKNQTKRKSNPYGLKFKEVSEEDIIRGAIESGVAVFLHGPSSEGKSARVKQIDPTCEIIYLRNASPESLNGKSVYNQATGEMIDIKPSWLKKLEKKCEKEPDRYHVVFFDEITNALPSIQGIAFNIVLDKEVNGIWELPDNARIVAAGNDMKDSLAANQLAEPLFNRFAHVYIKTTTESWLKWASEHNIHPAIYSYIAYTKGSALRSIYDGEKPNADPRKWEMASKMLYSTGKPEMLRALVGEEITREFVQFCNQQVITLEDVIDGNYTKEDMNTLNTAERYATIMGLSQVDEDNLEKVREFVIGLGEEYRAIFDALWTHGDENRIERLAEAQLAEASIGGVSNER